MSIQKRQIHNDTMIKIRILKALGDTKPYGTFKHFYMIRISRFLKRPNVISTKDIWEFLKANYDLEQLDNHADEDIQDICFEMNDAISEFPVL